MSNYNKYIENLYSTFVQSDERILGSYANVFDNLSDIDGILTNGGLRSLFIEPAVDQYGNVTGQARLEQVGVSSEQIANLQQQLNFNAGVVGSRPLEASVISEEELDLGEEVEEDDGDGEEVFDEEDDDDGEEVFDEEDDEDGEEVFEDDEDGEYEDDVDDEDGDDEDGEEVFEDGEEVFDDGEEVFEDDGEEVFEDGDEDDDEDGEELFDENGEVLDEEDGADDEEDGIEVFDEEDGSVDEEDADDEEDGEDGEEVFDEEDDDEDGAEVFDEEDDDVDNIYDTTSNSLNSTAQNNLSDLNSFSHQINNQTPSHINRQSDTDKLANGILGAVEKMKKGADKLLKSVIIVGAN